MKITLLIMTLSIAVSGICPADYVTWLMEIAPIVIGLPFVYRYGRQGNVSNCLLCCIAVHSVILAIGGHYTYADVPFGNWLVQAGLCERNNYDKIGHFMQGFTPALLFIEVCNRKGVGLEMPRFMATIAVFVAAGFSAMYEIIEWFAAVMLGSGADEFLGTQGYVWDTQSDMFFAILGAVGAVLFLSGYCRRGLLNFSESPPIN